MDMLKSAPASAEITAPGADAAAPERFLPGVFDAAG